MYDTDKCLKKSPWPLHIFGNYSSPLTARDSSEASRVKVSSELTQDRRTWSASVRGEVNAIGDTGSTRPG